MRLYVEPEFHARARKNKWLWKNKIKIKSANDISTKPLANQRYDSQHLFMPLNTDPRWWKLSRYIFKIEDIKISSQKFNGDCCLTIFTRSRKSRWSSPATFRDFGREGWNWNLMTLSSGSLSQFIASPCFSLISTSRADKNIDVFFTAAN